jgi:hypothetical protein
LEVEISLPLGAFDFVSGFIIGGEIDLTLRGRNDRVM